MKTIKINDRRDSTHYINTVHIVSIEHFQDNPCTVYLSDGRGILTDMGYGHIRGELERMDEL